MPQTPGASFAVVPGFELQSLTTNDSCDQQTQTRHDYRLSSRSSKKQPNIAPRTRSPAQAKEDFKGQRERGQDGLRKLKTDSLPVAASPGTLSDQDVEACEELDEECDIGDPDTDTDLNLKSSPLDSSSPGTINIGAALPQQASRRSLVVLRTENLGYSNLAGNAGDGSEGRRGSMLQRFWRRGKGQGQESPNTP